MYPYIFRHSTDTDLYCVGLTSNVCNVNYTNLANIHSKDPENEM